MAAFVDPRQAFGPDKVIPPEILANAKVSAHRLSWTDGDTDGEGYKEKGREWERERKRELTVHRVLRFLRC